MYNRLLDADYTHSDRTIHILLVYKHLVAIFRNIRFTARKPTLSELGVLWTFLSIFVRKLRNSLEIKNCYQIPQYKPSIIALSGVQTRALKYCIFKNRGYAVGGAE